MSIRARLLLTIAAPLLGLLCVMLALDAWRLHDNALDEADARLLDVCDRNAWALDAQLRAMAQVARTTAGLIEADEHLGESELYELLRHNVETDPLITSAAIIFEPGAFTGLRLPPGTAIPASSHSSDSPVPPTRSSRPRTGEFAPAVLRHDDAGTPSTSPSAPSTPLTQPAPLLATRAPLPFARTDLALQADPFESDQPWAALFRAARAGTPERWLATSATTSRQALSATPSPQSRPALWFAVPFSRGTGHFGGIVTLSLDAPALLSFALRAVPQDVRTLLVDHEGATIPLPAPLAERTLRPSAPALARMLAGSRSSAEITAESTPGSGTPGSGTLLRFASVPSPGWSIAVGLDRSSLLAPVWAQVRKRLLDGLIFISATSILVVSIGSRIVRPLRRMARAVRGIEAGAATVPTMPAASERSSPAARRRSGDEVSELGRALDSLLSRLVGPGADTSATRQRDQADTEQTLALQIQASLRPRDLPPLLGVDIHGVSTPARAVGGDFYDIFPLSGPSATRAPSNDEPSDPAVAPDKVAIVIGDVSGKGVQAAMLMAVTRTLVRDLATSGLSPGPALERANTLLLESNPAGMFVSLFLGVYSISKGELVFASAGHPSPVLVSASGAASFACAATGTVLGIAAGLPFGEGSLLLAPGDSLVVYSDGVSEARTNPLRSTPASAASSAAPSADFLGNERLLALCQHLARSADSSQALGQAIKAQVDAFAGPAQHDDLTILVLRRPAIARP